MNPELAEAIEQEAGEYLAIVVAAARGAEAARFKPVSSDAELVARFPEAYWASFHALGRRVDARAPALFPADRHPYVSKLGASRAYHIGTRTTWDYLRHELTIDSNELVIIEGVNEALVRLPGRGAPFVAASAEERPRILASLAAALFAEPWSSAAWLPRRPAAGEADGLAYTTAPTVSPLVANAARARMDAGVFGGELTFIHYKFHNDEQASRMLDGRSWSARR
jgi:hypothetical protein